MTRPSFTNVTWRKSTACNDGESCVEVAHVGSCVGVRDSSGGSSRDRTLIVDTMAWKTFITDICARDTGSTR
jgi:hypothetical protein